MPRVSLHNVGMAGVVSDRPAHTLPPEMWSDARNMRFLNRQAVRMAGHTQVLGTPSVDPGFILNVPSGGNSLWVYGDTDHVYVNDAGVHTQITRAAGATPYTATNLWDWNTCFIGGIPIFNNGADIPQYWPTLSAATDLADLSNWGTYPEANLRAKVMRSFGRFLIAMNTSDNTGNFPHRAIWSSQAGVASLPASWDVTDPIYDTGQVDLTDVHSGEIRDGLILGNQFYIYKELATHVMRYIGGANVMAFEPLLSTGIIAPRCVCLFDKGRRHFIATEDDVIMHSGTKEVSSVVEARVRARLFTELNQNAKTTCFVFDNFIKSEVWFCYPSGSATLPDKALVFDYKANTISFRDWQGLSVSYGAITDAVAATWASVVGTWATYAGPWNTIGGKALVTGVPEDTKMYQLESGNAYGSLTVTSFLERTGLAVIGKDRQGEPKVDYSSRKQISRVWPKITGTGASQVKVQVGKQEEIDGSVTWSLPKNFDPSVRYLDFDDEDAVSGRLNAIRLESTVDLPWQCEGVDLELNVLGEM